MSATEIALEGEDTRPTMESVIELVGVEKHFGAAGIHALASTDLSVGRGEFVAIVGPSGCGKSTIAKMIAGLYAPTSGEVKVFGAPVTEPPDALGFAFQQDLLLPWRTILENVVLKRSFSGGDRRAFDRRARELLKSVGLEGFESRYPRELSGGMKQRVALCRSLVDDPEILLLDEPFGALDAITRDQMAMDLQRLWLEKRQTVVLITHSIAEAVLLADRVIVLAPRPGRVQRIIDIDLERPRSLEVVDTAEFGHYAREIRLEFEAMGLY